MAATAASSTIPPPRCRGIIGALGQKLRQASPSCLLAVLAHLQSDGNAGASPQPLDQAPTVALLAVKEGRRGLQFAMSTNNMSDPRRPNKVLRYKPPPSECNPALDDPTPDYMNLLGMIFSMCGLMLKLKWCAWVAVYCSFISFANSRSSEDTKQMMSSFMLSISAVVMSYLQNPQPMTPPW